MNVNEQIPICEACPPGHKCPNAGDPPVPCPSGSFAIGTGNTDCTAATAGQAAPNPDSDKYDCPTGYQQLSGNKRGCEKEDATTDTSGNNYSGYYAWPESNIYKQCPEGFYCATIPAEPVQCIEGWYSAAGATVCIRCEAGSACPTPYASAKITCSAGTYSELGSVACYEIPPHKASDESTNGRSDYPGYCQSKGQVSKQANTGSCASCALNEQCPSDNLDPVACDTARFTSRNFEEQCFPK
jgi:hypothetical protein